MVEHLLNGFLGEIEKTSSAEVLKRLKADGVKIERFSSETQSLIDLFKQKHGLGHVTTVRVGRGSNVFGNIVNKTALYFPQVNLAVTPSKDAASILHELGHAADYKKMGPARKFLGKGRSPGVRTAGIGLGVAGAFHEKTRKYAPIAPVAIQLPVLYEEGKASASALKHMYQEGKKAGRGGKELWKGMKRLTPAFGTYLGSALLPAAGIYVLGKLLEKQEKNNAYKI